MRYGGIAWLAITIVAACAPDDHAGEPLAPCRTGRGPACNPGLRCIGTVCTPCGFYDTICCNDDGQSSYCDGNLACEDGDIGLGNCTGDCGYNGEACCLDDTCPGGGDCGGDGLCFGPPDDPCFSGSTMHTVEVIDEHCEKHTVTLWTDTLEQAEACRQKLVGEAHVDAEVCPLDTAPTATSLCKDGFGPLVLETCSSQQLEVCQNAWCFACEWQPATDTCPLGPLEPE